jgi:hypothetical protein
VLVSSGWARAVPTLPGLRRRMPAGSHGPRRDCREVAVRFCLPLWARVLE